ncbi:enoyl-CoA hydratase/isomerase family protein [Hirschia baltica]|uniref:Enoyl-CoA hydratase/isomerase n=1 Tax=Hirschia baltica (strain ATCC 49814 / DSM 5838 / IFAM 1418) TaxID=582402 RepID=C6XQZ5_HIRBI|nr:enoyl-CoA hydratase-related protein [Hirschia baltica]ACT60526.1 Enoyl-CoA hydratase/isomerase [Hirschia baltica ATCC 49814]
MSEFIVVTQNEMVTTLTITRQDKKNAITKGMYSAMADAILAYGEDKTSRAFVITGAGDMFTSGNDISDFTTDLVGSEKPPVVRFLDALRDCPKPIIAAVNAHAIGIGLTMLLHCDLVYAHESATFGAPFVKLGVVPEAASSMLLPEAVGMAVANDILLAGRTLNAQEALDFGLISRVFSDTDFKPSIEALAHSIAGSAPESMRKSKDLIRNYRGNMTDHMNAEFSDFADQLKSPEFAESIAAKMQKRKPVYK